MSRVSIVAPILVAIVALVAAMNGYLEVSLDQLKSGDIGTLLLTVTFTALVIERAVEVYINNAFDPKETRLTRDATVAGKRVEIAEEATRAEMARQAAAGVAADPAAIRKLREEGSDARAMLLDEKEKVLAPMIEHKSEKAAWAAAMSTFLSLAAAAVGVRILGQFLTPETIAKMSAGDSNQLMLFRAADIILTSFVLAGGADGIHKIITRFTVMRKNSNQG